MLRLKLYSIYNKIHTLLPQKIDSTAKLLRGREGFTFSTGYLVVARCVYLAQSDFGVS